MEHIAVFRMSAMGDVAISVPVITAFSEQYPDVKITYLTRPLFAPMFSHLPNVEVFTPELNGKHWLNRIVQTLQRAKSKRH